MLEEDFWPIDFIARVIHAWPAGRADLRLDRRRFISPAMEIFRFLMARTNRDSRITKSVKGQNVTEFSESAVEKKKFF